MLLINGAESVEAYIIASNWSLNEWKDLNTAREYILDGLRIHVRDKKLLKHFFETELVGATIEQENCRGKSCAHVLK